MVPGRARHGSAGPSASSPQQTERAAHERKELFARVRERLLFIEEMRACMLENVNPGVIPDVCFWDLGIKN